MDDRTVTFCNKVRSQLWITAFADVVLTEHLGCPLASNTLAVKGKWPMQTTRIKST